MGGRAAHEARQSGGVAGGAAIHFEPSSARYSKDVDLFHDTVQGVATSSPEPCSRWAPWYGRRPEKTRDSSPHLRFDLLKRRGHHRPDAFNRLDLVEPWDVVAAKREWLDTLESVETFLSKQQPDELGAIYW